MPPGATTRTSKLAGIGVFGLLAAALVLVSPADSTLGGTVRFLYLHGATTWANLATFTLAAVTAAVFLIGRAEGQYLWASAFRYVSLPLWAANTLMGVYSMRLVWGGILWTEPRLRMTFIVLMAALLVFAADLTFARRRLTAGLDVALALVLWGLLATTPNLFHPDNPVLNSSATIIAFFIAMTAAITVVVVLVTWLVRDGLARRGEAPLAG